MQLLQALKTQVEREESPFRIQLLKEDIQRLEKLLELAQTANDLAGFQKAGSRIGWTQNDMMTHRVAEPLNAVLEAIYHYHHGEKTADDEKLVHDAWLELCVERNEKLIKCL